MKKTFLLFLLFGISQMHSQSVLGKWKTIDDKTNQAKSIVEIYESNGKVYGKVIEIFNEAKRNNTCTKCTGADKNKPVLGLVIIKGLSKDGEEYSDGKILDPESGSLYKCMLKLVGKEKLEVRGYMGISLIGRSQTWVRAK